MANFKISGLPAASSVLTSDQFEVNQGGVSKRVTAAQILAGENYFTAKSVLFAGDNGEISQDNASFRYDSATKKMAIGNSSFATQLLTLGTPGGPAGSIYLAGSTSGAVVLDVSSTATRLQINAGIAVNSELIYSTTSKGLSLIANPGAAGTGFTIQNTFNNANAVASIQLLNANSSQDVRFQAFGQGSSDNAYIGTASNTGFDIYTNGLKSLITSNAGEMTARAGLSLYTDKWSMSRTTTQNFVGQEDDGVGMLLVSNYQGSNNTAAEVERLMYLDGNNYHGTYIYGSTFATVGLRNSIIFTLGTTTSINLVQSSSYTIQYNGTAKFALAATTGAATFHSGSVTTGVTGSQTGSVTFSGGTSGAAILTAAAAAGTPTLTLPSTTGTLALVGSSVPSIQGTADQVLVNGGSGSAITGTAVTLTLPQSIAISSNVQFATIGIGVAPSGAKLEIVSESGSDDTLLTHYSSDANAPGVIVRKARGTLSSPSGISTNDRLLFLGGRGYNNAAAFSGNAVAIQFRAAEAFTASAIGTYIDFETTPIGSTTRATRVRVTDAGLVWINTTTGLNSSVAKLQVNGWINSALQTGNAALVSGDMYKDTAANILANGDWIVGMKV